MNASLTKIQTKDMQNGLVKVYNSLLPHQLALYHGVPVTFAKKIREQSLTSVPIEQKFKAVISIGGFRSGKTFADCFKKLTACIKYPKYLSLVVRKRKEQLRNTYLATFKEVVDLVTLNNKDFLILDDRELDGAIEILIRSSGEPSKIIFRIEPDGTDEEVRDSFKGYELGSYTLEEASQLREITHDTLYTRLSWRGGPVHASLLSNPAFEGHWLSNVANKYEAELASGIKPQALVIRSGT